MYLILLEITAVSSFCHAGTAWADMEEDQEEVQQEAQKNKQGPGDEGEVQEYLGEEQNEKLKDQVLEYSEIQDMIRNYNPSVQEAVSAYNRTLEQYADGWAEMKFGKNSVATDKKNAKDSGDAQQYSYYAAEEAIYQSAAKSYQKMYDSMQSASSTSSQRKIERQMTVATQSLVISYETMRLERDTLEKERELYQKQYELAVVREQAGMGTQADVLKALNQVQSAEASIASTDESMAGLYDSICLSVGRDTNGGMVIAEIPAADRKRADGINLEEDTRKAIGNNDTLMSDRHSLQATSTSSSNYKLRTMEEGEQKLASKMKSLYDSVQQKKKALETAATGYEKAGREKQNADTKYSIGMLSQDEYLREQMNYIQRTAEYRSADLAFTQAMDAYDWAVLGIADIEA